MTIKSDLFYCSFEASFPRIAGFATCSIYLAFAATLVSPTGQAHADGRLKPGASYYFDTFEPAQKPWNPGHDLNYEEVFKNYLFFEVILAPSGKEITVNRFIQNNKVGSELYLLNPDGSLSRKRGGL